MTSPIAKALDWSKSHQGKKLIRFTAVSAITTSVSFISIALLYGLRIVPGVMWATLSGNLIASVPAYQLNRTWTWGKKGRSHLRSEIIPFWSMSLLGIGFSQLGAWWARNQVHSHHWAHIVNTGLVAGMNLASFAIFWVLKLAVFNKIFHVHVAEDIEAHLLEEEQAEKSAPSA